MVVYKDDLSRARLAYAFTLNDTSGLTMLMRILRLGLVLSASLSLASRIPESTGDLLGKVTCGSELSADEARSAELDFQAPSRPEPRAEVEIILIGQATAVLYEQCTNVIRRAVP